MRTTNLSLLVTSAIIAAITMVQAEAQVKGKVGEFSDVVIQGSILEPEEITVTDDAELEGRLKVPTGFQIKVFARDLINPRMLAISEKGILYATRRSVGDVMMLKDENGDGRSDGAVRVASRPGMHGIAFDGGIVYLAAVNDVFVADVKGDGTFGPLNRIIKDLPDGGQHPNRTLKIGPDGMLYISAGSTCNACAETNPESATMLRAKPDGSSRTIFASGLRNTIGFDWEPGSGMLYGMDHGIDWLGDEDQVEELNLIAQGKKYGWPYVYGMGELNPQDNPPKGITLEDWKRESTEPLLGYTAHSAPMQMQFYDGDAFPADFKGDAFIAMRGSWNRRPPSGYEVVRVNFENGKLVAFENFLEGFLVKQDDGGYGYLGRLAGLAVSQDGGLFVSDDTNGIIYKITYAGTAEKVEASNASPPDVIVKSKPSEIALELVDEKETVKVEAPFENGPIPIQYSADGDNASPPLKWAAAKGAKSFVVIADDPDATEPKPFVHWVLYDIPGDVVAMREGLSTDLTLPDLKMAKQGVNSTGAIGYTGPKPPVGDPEHHYHFQVFALDVETLGLKPGATREDVIAKLKGHVLAKGEVVGTFKR
jgi:Raf kinase inhibitor-like YbhB/YbcL family protein